MCVLSCPLFWTSSSLDVPAGVIQKEGHTGFLNDAVLLGFFDFFFRRSTGGRLRGDSAPAYATFRCFCSQLCSVFGDQICFKEAIMLVKYATLWLFTLPLPPARLFLLFSFPCSADHERD